MQIKISDFIVQFLKERVKSKHVFLLSGGGMMHLLNSLGNEPHFEIVPMHHEQAASIAADIYCKVADTPGICFVTTGPGCTNAITGVASAFVDSHPAFFISGQVSRANSKGELKVRQIGIQEIDPIPIVASITKYAVTIRDPLETKLHLEKALELALGDRPGPVWIDVPLDVQAAVVNTEDLIPYNPSPKSFLPTPKLEEQIDAAISALTKASRPLLVLGGGIHLAGLREEALKLAERLNIPIQTSWNGMDLIPENHPLFFGRANLFGPRYPNFIIQNCDYLLSLGARLGMQHTGYNVKAFAREAYKVMVDIDENELNKPSLAIDLKINTDLRAFFAGLQSKTINRADLEPWLDYCQKVKLNFPKQPNYDDVIDERYVNPYFFTKVLSDCAGSDIIFPIGSSGMGHTIITGLFEVKSGQRVFTSKGMAAMGYGVPSTVGACFASGKKLTITVVGDGGLQLNIQELQTIVHHQLPIKIFVFNNDGYHSIKMTQRNFFKDKFVGSRVNSGVSLPSLKKIADCYGFRYMAIASNNDLYSQVSKALECSGPTLCEVMIDPNKALEPKLVSYKRADGTMESRPLEDMAPLLPDEELNRWLFVRSLRDNKDKN